jgi:integrase
MEYTPFKRKITMARRTRGEGTIYQDKRGKWRGQIVIDGKRISCYKNTAKECRDWLREQQDNVYRGITLDATQITLDEFLDNWLANIKTRHRYSTYITYKSGLQAHIRPTLGEQKLSALKPFMIQNAIDTFIQNGKPIYAVGQAFKVLKNALNHAVSLNVLGYNPCNGVKPPKAPQRDIVVFDETQVQIYISAVDEALPKNPNRAIYTLAIGTGMRVGELLGLMWKDIDWDAEQISISRQRSTDAKNKSLVVPLKVKASQRTIKVAPLLMDLLQQHRDKQWERIKKCKTYDDRDIVFAGPGGLLITRASVRRGHYKIIEMAELPKIRFHDLRHTAISLMLMRGVPVIEVSKYAGHGNPTITLNTYAHFVPSWHSQAAMAMEDILTPVAVDL